MSPTKELDMPADPNSEPRNPEPKRDQVPVVPEERPDRQRDEESVDNTIDDSFPASDPPAWTSDTGAGAPKSKPKGD